MNNIKRAELHIHTKLSDDISVIGVKEIFDKAEELGLGAVAFTNLDNVQDFPEIMSYAKKYEGIKVVLPFSSFHRFALLCRHRKKQQHFYSNYQQYIIFLI